MLDVAAEEGNSKIPKAPLYKGELGQFRSSSAWMAPCEHNLLEIKTEGKSGGSRLFFRGRFRALGGDEQQEGARAPSCCLLTG
jgi:hypothetical protein